MKMEVDVTVDGKSTARLNRFKPKVQYAVLAIQSQPFHFFGFMFRLTELLGGDGLDGGFVPD